MIVLTSPDPKHINIHTHTHKAKSGNFRVQEYGSITTPHPSLDRAMVSSHGKVLQWEALLGFCSFLNYKFLHTTFHLT